MTAKLKNIKVLSLAKFQAALFALIGFCAGIIYSIGGLIYDLVTIGLSYGTALAFLALIGMPLLSAVIGFILGLVEAFLYNIFAGWFGGIQLDFELE
jgi:hypothetical protein